MDSDSITRNDFWLSYNIGLKRSVKKKRMINGKGNCFLVRHEKAKPHTTRV